MTTANTTTIQLRQKVEHYDQDGIVITIFEQRQNRDEMHASAIEVVTPAGQTDAVFETKKTAETVNLAMAQAVKYRAAIIARIKREREEAAAEPAPAWATAQAQIADAIIAYRRQKVKNSAGYEPVYLPFFNSPGQPATIVCGGEWNLSDGLDSLFSANVQMNHERDELTNWPAEVRVIVTGEREDADGEQTGIPLLPFNHCWEYDRDEDSWDFLLTPVSVRLDPSGYAEVRYSIDQHV